MLKSLLIRNFAVVSRLRIDFGQGLNILTGETGAGKSIIVDALSLLTGTRGAADIVRTGENSAIIEGVFELRAEAEQYLNQMLETIGIKFDDEDLVIKREIQASGRGRAFINDQSTTVATLRRLQPFLVEIHGQGEQQALLGARGQLNLLDQFAKSFPLVKAIRAVYVRWRTLRDSLMKLARDDVERGRQIELLEFQLDELTKIAPRRGELEELEKQRVLLLHAERVLLLKANAYHELYESDESILARLAAVRRNLQEWLGLDQEIAAALEAIENASLSLTDVAESLRDYGEKVDFSPSRLSGIEERLVELERLKRKYGDSLNEVEGLSAGLERQLEELVNWSDREGSLRKELESVEKEYVALSRDLTARRLKAAPQLASTVGHELHHVAMEGAGFLVRVSTAPEENRSCADVWALDQGDLEESSPKGCYWTPQGSDRVEFFLTANVGESARPLARVASGGELSRLMLVLRSVCQRAEAKNEATGHEVTMIFDEIDAGIGGRVAEAVGRRLQSLATTQQVLCVTHQPQIARFADHHYALAKSVESQRTVTILNQVDDEERVKELARMLGGSEDVMTARETARWLIQSGRDRHAGSQPPSARTRYSRSNKKPKPA